MLRRDLESQYPAIIWYNGSVEWHSPVIHHTTCPVNVQHFPWDNQTCILEFSSWTYNNNYLQLYNHTQPGNSELLEDGEWDLTAFTVQHRIEYFPAPYTVLYYVIRLDRKPLYHVFNFIFPFVMMTQCGVFVFLLPPDSGEKVSMSVTMLLSSSVYLMLIAEIMPVQSDNIPDIGEKKY